MGCDFTYTTPSHIRRSIEPSVCGRSILALIRSGSAEAGKAKTADAANAAVIPSVSITTVNASGAAIAPIWNVAVLQVTACSRWDRGTTFAVMAERAGPPSMLVTPSIAVTAYTCQGTSRSNITSAVISAMKMKLNDCVMAISFLRSI